MTAANNGTTMLAAQHRFHGGKSMQTLLRWHEQQEQPQHETSTTQKNDHPAADTFEQELQQQLFAPSRRSGSHSSDSDSDSDHEETEDLNRSPRWYCEEILPPPPFEIEGPSLLCLPTSGDEVDAIAVTIDATDHDNAHFIFTGLAEDLLFVAAARQHTEDDDDEEETRNEHAAAGAVPRSGSACPSSSPSRCRGGSNPEDEDDKDSAPKRRKISMEEDNYKAETQAAAAAVSAPPAPSRSCSSASTNSTTTQDHRNYIGE